MPHIWDTARSARVEGGTATNEQANNTKPGGAYVPEIGPQPLRRFIQFVEEIIANDDFKYGDGTSMIEDAKVILVELLHIRNLVDVAEAGKTLAYALDELAEWKKGKVK